MIAIALNIRQALNKAFLRLKPMRLEIDAFKAHLRILFNQINEQESEEFHKNLLATFLKDTYLKQNYFINTKGRNDLVIHNGKTAQSPVGVLMEVKKPTNKAEMPTPHNLNVKAFYELVLYFLRERITLNNLEIKHLIITNIYEWFVFDAQTFEQIFAQDRLLVQKFSDFEARVLLDTKTEFFYKHIAEPFIAQSTAEIPFAYFDLRTYKPFVQTENKETDKQLIPLFKIFSTEHLLKLPFANDSNTLDQYFYQELLHILGLTEIQSSGKKLIVRKPPAERHAGSVLENTITQIESLDKLNRIAQPKQLGEDTQEQLFNIGIELAITWINRILFLKLLEAQLLRYHEGNQEYAFLSPQRIKSYGDLNSLFFQVLARKPQERSPEIRQEFDKVPYLNSALFEPTELEQITLFISNLQDNKTLPLHPQTVLKDRHGNRLTGRLNTLQYLLAFLDAYDFGAEGNEEIQEENKTLINAAVLGLIFEKINGYKEGSFFTPGFITMYMCREALRKTVLQKFNEIKGWNCQTLNDLYNRIEDRKEANEIVNSLKICDNAVGSGHFLVSALNEIIAIKNDLKILLDRTGKRLKEYHVSIANDELVITDEDGQAFQYKPRSPESQRVQEAIFHEKQTLIEKCLFGVDINPNSAKICRLRLWIELLKNAYYTRESNFKDLETLPNIDINIKTGNSLVSRFSLDADLSLALKKSKYSIETYRVAVQTYRNAQNKEQKREMERLIAQIKSDFSNEISKNEPKVIKKRKLEAELFMLTHQVSVFELSEREKREQLAKIEVLTAEIEKLELEIAEMQNNPLFMRAFEWRFEFPEVLDDNGNFVGFDLVIGNPPYIRQEEIKHLKLFLQQQYTTYHGTADLYVYFIEKALQITRQNGVVSLVTNNKWLLTGYGEPLRKLLLQKRLIEIVNFGDQQVFNEATTYPAILTLQNQNVNLYKQYHNTVPLKIQKLVTLFKLVRDTSDLPEAIKQGLLLEDNTDNIELFEKNLHQLIHYKKELNGLFNILQQTLQEVQNLRMQFTELIEFRLILFKEKSQKDISTYVSTHANTLIQNNLTAQPWVIGENDADKLLKRIVNECKNLRDYIGNTAKRGIVTGLTEAFIIDALTREKISIDAKHASVVKPILQGRDIKPYLTPQPNKYLLFIPWHFPLHHSVNIQGASLEAEEVFKNEYPQIYNHLLKFKSKLEKRNRTETGIRYEWYAMQRWAADYWQEFEKPKIMYQALQVKPCFIYDEQGLYCNNSIWFIPTSDKALLGILNSRMGWWLISKYCTHIQNGYQLIWQYFGQVPIPIGQELLRSKITDLVNQILLIKRKSPQSDTRQLETEIDHLVYKLYGLAPEEIQIVERA